MSESPQDKIVRFLGAVPFFQDLGPEVLGKVVPRLRTIHLGAGALLMREGELGDTLYVLVSGRLGVCLTRNGEEEIAVEIGRGEVVGEMALLAGAPRSVSVRAIRDSNLLELDKENFFVLVRRYPQALLSLTRLIIGRLQRSMQTTATAASPVRTVAVVPAGSGADLERFSTRLVNALGRFGSAVLINRHRLQSQLRHIDTVSNLGDRLLMSRQRMMSQFAESGEEAARGSRLDTETTQWLHNLESSEDFVVYQSDPDPTPWTLRCCRQADRILLIGWARGLSRPNEIERMLRTPGPDGTPVQGLAKVDLVLLHEAGDALPEGTAEWLGPRRVRRCHHVRTDSDADLARLCRVLLDRQIGLVLSGGGARGVAHIGVLKALEERGVPVDAVGGSSFGSIMAAGIALGWDSEKLQDGVRRALVDPGSLLDYTVPLVALTRGRRATERIQAMFGDINIEDMRLPYFCVSSNLTRGAVTTHTQGPLWQAMRASVAIPGIFPPMRSLAGDVLVDGAIMNNLPVDILRTMMGGGGRVLAVNLRGDVAIPADDLPESGILSGWAVTWRRLLPFVRRASVPSVLEIIMRTAESGNVISTQRSDHDADLSFSPPVSEFSLLNFRAYERIIEAGYRHAMERLEGWPEINSAPEQELAPRLVAGRNET